MVVATKKREKVDGRAEALAVAERQLDEGRGQALAVLADLAGAITERRKAATARALVEVQWLEHRITQNTMNTALWCRGCAGEGIGPAEMPPSPAPWMAFECLEHAEPQLARSAKTWEWEIFGGLL